MPTNTKISLMYRDADNYKAHKEVIVSGAITAEQIQQIRSGLEDGQFIIADQVGLPTPSFDFMKYDSWPNDDSDHVWTTLPDFEGDVSPAELHTTDEETEEITIEQLAEAIANAKWDVPTEWARMQAAR